MHLKDRSDRIYMYLSSCLFMKEKLALALLLINITDCKYAAYQHRGVDRSKQAAKDN